MQNKELRRQKSMELGSIFASIFLIYIVILDHYYEQTRFEAFGFTEPIGTIISGVVFILSVILLFRSSIRLFKLYQQKKA